MTSTPPVHAAPPSSRPRASAPLRWLLAGYSWLGYAATLVALLYLAGFLVDLVVPRSVDGPDRGVGVGSALARDAALVLLFGLSHSVMARRWFKDRLVRVVTPAAERSTYVLVAAVALGTLMLLWTPVPGTLWHVTGTARVLLLLLNAAGWALALASTFAVDHADLFGLRQAWCAVTSRPYAPPALDGGGLHRHVRHPLMAGLLVAFWASPTMTAGHLALAAGLTLYVAIGVALEERDLLAAHGEAYAAYRAATPAVLPRPGRRR